MLSRGLGSMAASVRELLVQVREDQERKRQMELAVMQAQIQPHFLYNTLASVRHLIQMKDTERADQMIGALGRFFMVGLSGGKDLITLAEEIEHVKNYLIIQHMRYADAFSFEITEAN